MLVGQSALPTGPDLGQLVWSLLGWAGPCNRLSQLCLLSITGKFCVVWPLNVDTVRESLLSGHRLHNCTGGDGHCTLHCTVLLTEMYASL